MTRSGRKTRGVAAVVMVVVLLVVDLIVVGVVLAGSRDLTLSARRLETVQAFYAAEAGMNMAVREIMEGSDEDNDGGVGSISSEGNNANDPTLGIARFHVTLSGTTLTSEGRAGDARRTIEATVD